MNAILQERHTQTGGAFINPSLFLQSEEWEAFQQALGRATWRVRGSLVIRHDLPYGLHYLYAPRPGALDERFFSEIKKIAAAQKSVFLKIDPTAASILRGRASHSLQPQRAALLKISKSGEELLASMHPKTRYNIRLARRSEVVVNRDGSFQEFWDMLRETAQRDRFSLHPREHYEKMLAVRTPLFSNELFFARHGSQLLAAGMVNFYSPSRTAVYLHGASSREKKEKMAPYLLHWGIIEEAKQRGMSTYDFGGVDEMRWPGITRFKMGFGVSEHRYPQAVEVAYRPGWYALYRMMRRSRQHS